MLTAEPPELVDVELQPLAPERFAPLLAPPQASALADDVRRARRVFAGRTVWNVNSTSHGGGVAEMLRSLVAYARGAGVDARWTVIRGDPEFFSITKRIHNRLHGSPGDGEPLDERAREHYEAVLGANAQRLLPRIGAGDAVILHDPQTAGLVPTLHDRGVRVVWRCHVGVDHPNDIVKSTWDFLRAYVAAADACVFSSAGFVWSGLDADRITIIAPSIDPFALKNQELDAARIATVLRAAGLEDNDASASQAHFTHADGRPGMVSHTAEVTATAPIVPSTPLVAQISRWDRLKDPSGVLRGFVEHVAPTTQAHLVIAGPSVTHVVDDPEGLQVCEEVRAARTHLADALAERVHLATLPMDDPEENALIVNALQRRANIVVQKSLAEGFGLTVAEAMWKGRPVVASRLGGIVDQIEDGECGVLVEPDDLAGFGAAVVRLLDDPRAAARMGEAARERVRANFLGSRDLQQYLGLLSRLLHEEPA